MNNEEMIEAIKKLTYHVSLIGETIDYEKHPIEALILSNNWNESDINKAYDIFERWDQRIEKGEKISTGLFEKDFDQELGVSYQGVKLIILAFHRSDKWTNVCEAYVDAFENSPALEFRSIMRQNR